MRFYSFHAVVSAFAATSSAFTVNGPLSVSTRVGPTSGTTTSTTAVFAEPVKAGDKLPWGDMHWMFPPKIIPIVPYTAERNVIIVGLPAAFTPT